MDSLRHFLIDGPSDAAHTYIFAHGAGGAMDTPFMNRIARGVAANGIRVVRFEFPYMAARRTGGRRGAPDREPVLTATWREVISELHGGKIFIGGKSMGGRMASMVADECGVDGLICLGYPFHPPGKPDRVRTAHLRDLKTPSLIIQGTRDPFGTPVEVAAYGLSPMIRIEWLVDGDHSFRPRAASGATEAAHLDRAVDTVTSFVHGQG